MAEEKTQKDDPEKNQTAGKKTHLSVEESQESFIVSVGKDITNFIGGLWRGSSGTT